MTRLQTVLCAFALLCFALQAQAAPKIPDNMGAHAYQGPAEFNKVIDKKCTVCHSREPVDEAIKKHEDQLEIQQRMIEHGAQLTERDKTVLGAFWGDPLKGSGAMEPPQQVPTSLK